MNTVLTTLFDWALAPMRGLHPALIMAILSLLTGVVMLIIFKWTSNQKAIQRSKGRVMSQLLAIRLFKDDPWMTIRCAGGALFANVGYLRYALFPLVVMMVPVIIILIQLDLRFARAPLAVGETTRVGVTVDDASAKVTLVPAEDGAYVCETPPLRIPSLNEVNWRVRTAKEGVHDLRFEVDGKPFTKQLVVGTGLQNVSELRPGSLLDSILHPGESGLAGDLGIAAVAVDYPPRPFSLLGFDMAWWMAYFILTLIFAFALKGPMGVEA